MAVLADGLAYGLAHIFCVDAIDHILFLLVLCACYDYSKMKSVVLMVTAFTVGHMLAFFSVYSEFTFPVRSWAEIAIPITIILTGIINWLKPLGKRNYRDRSARIVYPIVLIFGAVHGLAISSEVKMNLLVTDRFYTYLIGVNLGIELAQIAVVMVILFLQMLMMSLFRVNLGKWKNGLSGIAIGAALIILMNKFY